MQCSKNGKGRTGCTQSDREKGSHNLEYTEPIPTILPRSHSERIAFFKTHDACLERGEYFGDGTPHTAEGYPFEPLSWYGHAILGGSD